MMSIRGIPTREINGLPYAVHQINDGEHYQIAIQNCTRHPAGYTFAPVYASYKEACAALQQWRSSEDLDTLSMAGDDTGSAHETLQ